MKTALSLITCAVISFCAVSQTQGNLVFYEGFNYAASASIDGVGGWSNTAHTVGVSATGLTYTGLATEGGSAKWANFYGLSEAGKAHKILGTGVSDLFKSTDSTFYISLLIGDSTGGNAERAIMQLWRNDAGTPDNEGIEVHTGGNPASGVTRIYDIGGGEGSAPTWLEMNGTRLIVGKITMQVGDDKFQTIRNPDLGTVVDSDFDLTDGTVMTALGDISATTENIDYLKVFFGTWGESTAAENSLLDEIRIGTTLADVIPVPEPASLALLGLGGLLMLNRRRRA
jgi:hypothetical protein